MRKQQAIIFVSLLLGLVGAAAAQAPSHLDRVNVIVGTDNVRVEMSSTGALAPKLSTLDSPARVVVELPETVMSTTRNHIPVGVDGVKGVRIGSDGQAHPMTRVVVDLDQACAYELTPGPAGKLVLTLHAAAGETTVAASSSSSSSSSVPASAPRVAESPAATAAAVKSEPASVASVSPASAAPKNFVFLEPKLQAKTAAANDSKDSNVPDAVAADDPASRSQEAAARFSDKTAVELLPVSAHASQAQSSTGSAQSSTAITPAVNLAAEQKAQAGQQNATAGPRYTGEPISVNLKDVDVKDFFRLIHEISGLNVVLDPNVHGTLTIVLDDVPWDQALDIVLKNNDLDKQLDGNVLRLATKETLKREADQNRDLAKAVAEAADVVTTTRVLSYGKATAMVPTLKKFLSSRGDIIADDRTNTLIIRDIPSTMPVIDNLIRQLDRKSRQVEIEARVVAANRSFSREIGTQFGFAGGNPSRSNVLGGTGSVGTSPIVRPNGPGFPTPPIVVSGGGGTSSGNSIPLNSNLGVGAPTSGIEYAFSSANFALDMIITAAEDRGVGKLLSKPKVITQNNEKATVKQGTKIPVQTIVNNTVSVQFVDAVLELDVTPQITAEGTVYMDVTVENDSIDGSIPRVQGIPAIDTQATETKVTVNDGATVVIGGIIVTQQTTDIQQVPLVGSVPILGNLFKHTTVNSTSSELLFFLTPRILPM